MFIDKEKFLNWNDLKWPLVVKSMTEIEPQLELTFFELK